MCGIFAYVGRHKAGGILLEGLKRLEYRGYDSAGLAVAEKDKLRIIKKKGRVKVVAAKVRKARLTAVMGISHTRWATHGDVNDVNAHPHLSDDSKIALAHNGVIENYESIKKFLLSRDHSFQSETDTEVLTNLIAYHYAKEPREEGKNRFLESVRKSLHHLEGTYGIAVICADCPHQIVGARKGLPPRFRHRQRGKYDFQRCLRFCRANPECRLSR